MVEFTSVENMRRSSSVMSSKPMGLTLPSASQHTLGSCGAWPESPLLPHGRAEGWLPFKWPGFQFGSKRLETSILAGSILLKMSSSSSLVYFAAPSPKPGWLFGYEEGVSETEDCMRSAGLDEGFWLKGVVEGRRKVLVPFERGHSPLPPVRPVSTRPFPLESRVWPAAAEAKLEDRPVGMMSDVVGELDGQGWLVVVV